MPSLARMTVALVAVVLGLVVSPELAASAPVAPSPVLHPAPGTAGTRTLVPSGQLRSVSCTASGFCMAVGAGVEQDTPLAERWDGTTWTVVPTVAVGPYDSFLSGVVCTSGSWCVAVGTMYTSSSAYAPIIEQWDGTTWSLVPLTGAVPADTQFNRVTCPSTVFCTAVGSGGSQAVLASWNGTAWSVSSVVAPDNTSWLQSVSCSSGSVCLATGMQENCGYVTKIGIVCFGTAPLVAAWDGSTWSLPAIPNGNGVFVGPVSCPPGTADCVAVGASNDSGNGLTDTTIETWDGTNWMVTPGPTIGPTGGSLSGISCPTAAICLAAGSSSNLSATVQSAPVAFTWDGASASLTTPPNPSPSFAELNDVSCASGTSCVSVGEQVSDGVDHTLVESWQSGSWTVVPSPDAGPTITTTSILDAYPGTPYGPVQLEDAGMTTSTAPYVTAVRWSKVPGTELPRGMTLSATGELAGTPNRHLAAGPTDVSVQITEKATTVVGGKRVKSVTTVQAVIPITIS